ncbi:hypothetical protein BCE_1100 [Bacillus cereus ATCC 10987]|uniref:Uncharacterized protein n=1 Tax=Bacillus cereus (strain ATCC 10987 / NRS 248) TaxID=222523 RepID=Q73CG5_BACC1|nr:hypothetical protein BCE_1100 [Bacillus cereus ATCC 10987]
MFPLSLIGFIIAFLVWVVISLVKNKGEQKDVVYPFDKIDFS